MYVGKLKARLGFAIFIMILLPFIFMGAMVLGGYYLFGIEYTTENLLISLAIAGGWAGFQLLLLYFIGPASIGRTYGQKLQWIDRDYDPRLWDMIYMRMEQAGVKLVKIGILKTDEINAFVYGYGKKNARLVITEGLLKHLDFDEIEGVVGHELGHVRHKDMTITLMLIAIPMLIQSLYYFTYFSGGGTRRRDSNMWLFIIFMMVLFYATYLASILLMRYISRIREYYADAHSVELLKTPKPIVQALAKLTYRNSITEDSIIKTHTNTHALMIISPMASATQAKDADIAIKEAKKKINLDKYGDIGGADIDEDKLEEQMAKELKEKGQIMRTHPLTANRIMGALKFAEELKLI
ncbi:MAG: M48 family metalloprotease [Candidatus Helarchaeota archaeon]